MRTRLVALVASALLITASASAAAGASDPFHGSWSTVDIDGSRMTVTFNGTGDVRRVDFIDHRSTICGGVAQTATGLGTVAGDQLDMVGTTACDGSGDEEAWTATYTFDPAGPNLFDGTLAWERGFGGPDAFAGSWFAEDVDGSSMKLSLGGSGLTRSVVLVDNLATGACEPAAPITLAGKGLIGSVLGDGRFIAVEISGRCGGGGAFVEAFSKFEYDVWTNTLIGPLDPQEIGGSPTAWTVVWHR